MKQSNVVSFIEANMNVLSGFFISLAVWVLIVAPLYDIEVVFRQNLEITGIFTVASVARAYVWRRVFVNWLNPWLHKVIRGEQDAVL